MTILRAMAPSLLIMGPIMIIINNSHQRYDKILLLMKLCRSIRGILIRILLEQFFLRILLRILNRIEMLLGLVK
jgi:hypothetical protein